LKIKEHLNNKIQENQIAISQKSLDKFVTLLSKFHKGNLIYPGVLIRALGITMKEAYKLLNFISDLNIIKINFEVYCYRCSKYTGDIYSSIKEIPSEIYCEECEDESKLDPIENTIVVYRILED
jgi:hypothetical protein